MKLKFKDVKDANQAWEAIESAHIEIKGPRYAYRESPDTIIFQNRFQGGWFDRFTLPAPAPAR